jgi:hypothetical protein
MNSHPQILACTAVVAVAPLLSVGCAGQPDPSALPPDLNASRLVAGEPFPDVVLPSLEGAPRTIHEFRGEKLILHIFASW